MNIASPDKNPYWQKNISFSILESATKTLLAISKKLALSPLDRAALKVDDVEETDDFLN
jgi:phage terminase small subunit